MKDFEVEKFSQRIKDLRCDSGMTQKQLAELIGVKQNTIAQYEKGTTKPSLEIIVKLAEIFKTTTDFLLCGHD